MNILFQESLDPRTTKATLAASRIVKVALDTRRERNGRNHELRDAVAVLDGEIFRAMVHQGDVHIAAKRCVDGVASLDPAIRDLAAFLNELEARHAQVRRAMTDRNE
jgi:hypothetical protein